SQDPHELVPSLQHREMPDFPLLQDVHRFLHRVVLVHEHRVPHHSLGDDHRISSREISRRIAAQVKYLLTRSNACSSSAPVTSRYETPSRSQKRNALPAFSPERNPASENRASGA